MSENKYKFQKLTPINNIDLKIYGDALNFVFSNNDIKNIAISGAYGSGKSSVIETYKEEHPEINFITISLAHFESNDNKLDNVAKVLEGKIINQLIHKVDYKKIPQTNFKLRHEVSNFNIILSTLKFIVLVLLILYIVEYENWSQFILSLQQNLIKDCLEWTADKFYVLLSIFTSICIFGTYVYSVIKMQKNKKIFKKIKLQGAELEIFEQNEESYFDKHLNEVLYLFENCGAHAIIFEDMDRYNVNQIFEKLREINTLINNKKENPIRFFYLLRDDLFISKDRTKFFDFIVPIIPVMDSSNSFDQFIDHLKKGKISEDFNEEFLQGLSLYVDDMRLLKNIYNEFVVYNDRIHSFDIELKKDKLLAIITYKNIFPKDFNDLQLGSGFVFTLFENKSKFIEEVVNNIEKKIEGLEDNIRLSNAEFIQTITELDTLFFPIIHNISSVAGKRLSEFNTYPELVQAIKENPNVTIIERYSSTVEKNLESQFENLLSKQDYVKRKEAIERNMKKKIETSKIEIQELQNKKNLIQNSKLRYLINKGNIDSIFSINFTNEIGVENKFEDIKANPYFPLIKYLIRNGYIDETYPNYMTYFYEQSLSLIDWKFLRSIMDETPKKYSYALVNPKLVFSRLKVADFNREEILNFDLLSYVLRYSKSSDDEKCIIGALKQLAKSKNYNFVNGFLDRDEDTSKSIFIKSLNKIWTSVFEDILSESNFSYEQKKQYILQTLYCSPDTDIKKLDDKGFCLNFISNDPKFLDIDSPNIGKIINGLNLLNVKFMSIDYDISNKELFYEVYKNNQYQLSFEIIKLMLEKIYGLKISDDFKTKNYTLITSKSNEPLALYINKNINNYISVILKSCESIINDEESVVILILNNDEIDIDNKNSYIGFLQTIIENINDIDDEEFWSLLLEKKLVKPSDNNILSYFFKKDKGWDSYLVEFANTCGGELSFNYTSIVEKFGKDSAMKFYADTVKCEELSNSQYEAFLSSFDMVYSSFPFEGLADGKIEILLKLSVLKMTVENLTFMREHYSEHIPFFITKNIDKYKDIINEKNFDIDEMLVILDDENIKDGIKLNLLKYSNDAIKIEQKNYSAQVKKYILEHNLNEDDIPFILRSFPNEDDSVKDIIKRISIENITEILEEGHEVSQELLSSLFATTQLEFKIKKKLLLLYLEKMNESKVKEHLKTLQMDNFLSLFEGKRPKIEADNINKKILDVFLGKKWICSYNYDKNNNEFFRANGRNLNNTGT